MKTLISLLMVLCGLFQQTVFAAPTMQVEPQRITVNDTFRLILTSDNPQSGGIPNLTPLQNEFTILGTERSMSYSMVNGQTSAQSQWIILLRPKKVGRLVVPAIKVGQEETPAGMIDVSGGSSSLSSTSVDTRDNATDGVMLKTEVSTPTPYVNQQILYTVKLLSNAQLLNAEYHPPSVDNALLIPLGDGRHGQTEVNGSLYAVEEQQYAIFPQKSGPLTIHPPSFQAAVYDRVPRRVTVEAKETLLSVRPVPNNYQGEIWLPAKKITLAETYEPIAQTLREGDTLSRTVTLTAVSMPAQLLPALTFAANDDFNVYPDTPEIKNVIRQNELLGTSTVKVTYLFNHKGRVTIPPLEMTWFNTDTGQAETATLPAHTLTIQANAAAPKSKTNASSSSKISMPSSHLASPSTAVVTAAERLAPKLFAWAFVAGFALAFGLMILIWWLWPSKRLKRGADTKAAVKQLKEACQKNRPGEARDALLLWARAQWPEARILNLSDVAMLSRDVAFKKQITVLTQALYHFRQSTSWQGEGLWRSFDVYQKQRQGKKPMQSNELPPIHPV